MKKEITKYTVAVVALLCVFSIIFVTRDSVVIDPSNIFYNYSFNRATDDRFIIRAIDFNHGLHDDLIADLKVERNTKLIRESWKKDTLLFIKNNTGSTSLYTLNIKETAPTLTHLVDIILSEDTESIDDIRFLNNDELIYVSTKLRDHGDPTLEYNYYWVPGNLGIVNIKDPSKKMAYPLTNTVKYGSTGYKLLSKTQDGRIFLQESGLADGGYGQYAWHTFDQKTKEITLLNEKPPLIRRPADGGSLYYFYDAKFNSDSSKIAYVDFQNEIPHNELGEGLCLKPGTLEKYENGFGTVMTYDTKTGEKTELYRNTTHSDDLCKNWIRQINSLTWADDSTLIFSTSEGVFSIDTKTKKLVPLYSYPLKRGRDRIRVFGVRGNYLLLIDSSRKEDLNSKGEVWVIYSVPNFIVVDMNTGKNRTYPPMSNIQDWITVN